MMRALSTLAFAAALVTAAPAAAQTLTIVGQTGAAKTLGAAELAGLPRAQATMIEGATKTVYEGVTLTSVLREAGVPAGARMHGAPMKLYVLVTGQDGYQIVLSLAETDDHFSSQPVILADRKAGGPLEANEAPLRLVVDGELRPWRAVKQVAKIEVKAP
jgi:DMSO/TMAO reductase YedYZ molybdopterin-dependent catalytic subunit